MRTLDQLKMLTYFFNNIFINNRIIEHAQFASFQLRFYSMLTGTILNL